MKPMESKERNFYKKDIIVNLNEQSFSKNLSQNQSKTNTTSSMSNCVQYWHWDSH